MNRLAVAEAGGSGAEGALHEDYGGFGETWAGLRPAASARTVDADALRPSLSAAGGLSGAFDATPSAFASAADAGDGGDGGGSKFADWRQQRRAAAEEVPSQAAADEVPFAADEADEVPFAD